MPDASEWLSGSYEEYTDSAGQKYKTRVPTASMEWVLKATDNKQYCIKFDKNFAKKHLFTYTKKPVKPEDKEAANMVKMTKQAGHRTNEEQGRLCKHCGHGQKRHQTGSGAPVACKEPVPGATPSNCGCMNFENADSTYEVGRAAKNKPTSNPLAGATFRKSTYIVMNEIDKAKFEKVVVDSIQAAEAGWTKDQEKDLDWNFDKAGAVVNVDLDQLPADWVKAKGVKVGVKNITAAPDKPTFEVYHYVGTIT